MLLSTNVDSVRMFANSKTTAKVFQFSHYPKRRTKKNFAVSISGHSHDSNRRDLLIFYKLCSQMKICVFVCFDV